MINNVNYIKQFLLTADYKSLFISRWLFISSTIISWTISYFKLGFITIEIYILVLIIFLVYWLLEFFIWKHIQTKGYYPMMPTIGKSLTLKSIKQDRFAQISIGFAFFIIFLIFVIFIKFML